MGIWETFTDLVEAATPWSTVEAEAPPAEEKEEQKSETKDDDSKEETKDDDAKTEDKDESENAEEAEEEDEEEEEEEEDDEEIEDPKEKFEEECRNSKQCAPAKHHYDECVERVTGASSDEGAGEDCVEEFFHLAHCATQCAAPKVWSALK